MHRDARSEALQRINSRRVERQAVSYKFAGLRWKKIRNFGLIFCNR